MLIVQRRRVAASYSTAAQDYITRVIAADAAAGNSLGLESGVKNAYAAFIDGMISAGFFSTSGGVVSTSSVINCVVIGRGAQTWQGSMIPIVGPSPTAYIDTTTTGWATAGYDRKRGWISNQSRWINTNRNNNIDQQNNNFRAVFIVTSSSVPYSRYLNAGDSNGAGDSIINQGNVGGTDSTASLLFSNNASGFFSSGFSMQSTGLIGTARTSSSSFIAFAGSTEATSSTTSQTPSNKNFGIFRNPGDSNYTANNTIAGYFIGAAPSNRTTLRSLIETLMTDLATAIP